MTLLVPKNIQRNYCCCSCFYFYFSFSSLLYLEITCVIYTTFVVQKAKHSFVRGKDNLLTRAKYVAKTHS